MGSGGALLQKVWCPPFSCARALRRVAVGGGDTSLVWTGRPTRVSLPLLPAGVAEAAAAAAECCFCCCGCCWGAHAMTSGGETNEPCGERSGALVLAARDVWSPSSAIIVGAAEAGAAEAGAGGGAGIADDCAVQVEESEQARIWSRPELRESMPSSALRPSSQRSTSSLHSIVSHCIYAAANRSAVRGCVCVRVCVCPVPGAV